MNVDIKGALKKLDKIYLSFEHKGKIMTKDQVKKVLEYGLEKGYEHTGQLTDQEVDLIICPPHNEYKSENDERKYCSHCGKESCTAQQCLDE